MAFTFKPSIAELYLSGFSTRQIAEKLGKGKTIVGKIIKELGLSRSKSDAAVLRQPQKSTHWRTSRSNARNKVQRKLGYKLPPELHVHHIDGDYTNNDISNLEVKERSKHIADHHPKNPIPRHIRRREYMRNYLREYYRRKKNV